MVGEQVDDPLDFGEHAPLQHLVRLVEDEAADVGNVHKSLADEVQEPSRCGHQDIHAFFEGLGLGVLGNAAEDDGGPQLQVGAVPVEGLADLEGQFPGGGDHERPDDPRVLMARMLQGQLLQDGDGEGRRLARARLGAAQKVFPRQKGRDGLGLDGRGLLVALFVQGSDDGLNDAQFV